SPLLLFLRSSLVLPLAPFSGPTPLLPLFLPLLLRPPPTSSPFPYTTLFRSARPRPRIRSHTATDRRHRRPDGPPHPAVESLRPGGAAWSPGGAAWSPTGESGAGGRGVRSSAGASGRRPEATRSPPGGPADSVPKPRADRPGNGCCGVCTVADKQLCVLLCLNQGTSNVE